MKQSLRIGYIAAPCGLAKTMLIEKFQVPKIKYQTIDKFDIINGSIGCGRPWNCFNSSRKFACSGDSWFCPSIRVKSKII